MELYVNGVPSAGGSAGTTWASGCSTFALSQWVTGGTAGGFINGKIADVQTWNTTLSPLQVASMSMTPGYLMFFQPDGNLVIYNDYGQTLWASGTA